MYSLLVLNVNFNERFIRIYKTIENILVFFSINSELNNKHEMALKKKHKKVC